MTTILLTGPTGQVGRELKRTLASVGRVVAVDRTQMDLTHPDTIREVVRAVAPQVIVNAAGYTTVDKVEAEPALAESINAAAPGILAEEARRADALLVHYSTDYVYDGLIAGAYVEEDEPRPVNVYGRTKLAGEQAIAASGCAHLILRTSWVYSDCRTNFVLTILRLAQERAVLRVVQDQIGSPTWARMLAGATAQLLADLSRARGATGIYHLSASGHVSRYAFAQAIIESARRLRAQSGAWASVEPVSTAEYPLPATRPLNCATSKDKVRSVFGVVLPDWRTQLDDFLANFLGASRATAP